MRSSTGCFIRLGRLFISRPVADMNSFAGLQARPGLLHRRLCTRGGEISARPSRLVDIYQLPKRATGMQPLLSSSNAAAPLSEPRKRTFSISPTSWWTSFKASIEEDETNDTRALPEAPLSIEPTEAHRRELHAVNVAVAVNVAIMIAKLGAWFITSSG